METKGDPRSVIVTEVQLANISDDVGNFWRELGPRLNISAAKIHNIDNDYKSSYDKANFLLVTWKQQEGSNATVGCLTDALERIKRKSIAEKLLGRSDFLGPTSETVSKGDTMSLKVIKIRDKLILCEDAHGRQYTVEAVDSNKGQWNSEEVRERHTNPGATSPEMPQSAGLGEDSASNITTPECRETRVKKKLSDIKVKLRTYLTLLLQVPEVNQDQLGTHATLELLTNASKHLQDIYTATLCTASETYNCTEDVRNDFFDLACFGLRGNHHDLVNRVNALESTQEGMSEKDQKAFKRLQGYQKNRQREVEKLDSLCRSLFKPPEYLPGSSASAPCAADKSSNDTKVRDRHTNPGATIPERPQCSVLSVLERQTSPGVTSPERPQSSGLSFTEKKSPLKSLIQNCGFTKRKDDGENKCSVVSYTRRDS